MTVLYLSKVSFADTTTLGVARGVVISDPDVGDGDIIVASSDGFRVSKKSYNPLIFGVVTAKPALELKQNDLSGTYPVISNGFAEVKVTASGGAIKKGDFLTSSDVSGTAMKAGKEGFVLGTALEDYSSSGVGKIKVNLNITYYNPAMTGSSGGISNLDIKAPNSPGFFPTVGSFNFLKVGLIVVLFVLSLWRLSYISSRSLTELSRNPMGEKGLKTWVFINVLILWGFILAAFFVISVWLK